MTPAELASQEEHLFAVLSSQRFLKMEGLSKEIPFFIYPYPPENALEITRARRRISNRLAQMGITIREINLYTLSIEILKERDDWDEVLEVEPEMDKSEFVEMLQSMLNPEQCLAPAIKKRLTGDTSDIVFLTGIGEVFPYIRSHSVLENLQSVVVGKPLLVFFPGRYEQSDVLGSSLTPLRQPKDDQYYRAKNIIEQEP